MKEAIDASLCYLNSPQALESLQRDPYWPKWDSPWWHMTLLWELDLARLIPKPAARAMADKLKSHYLPFFPLADADLPPGADPYRDAACHCAVGTMHQVLSACGIDVDADLPWMKGWLIRYQLPDGGLNCDVAAYRGSQKSSLLSTLPALEAILTGTQKRAPTADEEAFLDHGARYLIAHRLLRSTQGALIEPRWLKPCFPRFYDYDLLRGLSFLVRWSAWARRPLPKAAVTEASLLLETAFGEGPVASAPPACLSENSQIPQSSRWIIGPSRPFPLLKECAKPGPKEILTRDWKDARSHLRLLEYEGRLAD